MSQVGSETQHSISKRFLGVLPEAWNQLSFLESVDLRGNQISGPLPQTWSQLGALTILYVVFFFLTKVGMFRYLNENHLNGTLPADWWLGSFEQLGLSGNRLTGPLPVNWAHMAQIKVLDLSDNQFTGNLPEVRPFIVYAFDNFLRIGHL